MTEQITKWSQLRGKDSLKKWQKVKKMAAERGVLSVALLRSLIEADPDHGFMLASDENAATMVPEHFCGPSNLEYEETLVLNAGSYTTSRYLGRMKGHEKREFQSLREAVADASDDRRALVYVHAASGRFVCIGRDHWEWLMALEYVFKKAET